MIAPVGSLFRTYETHAQWAAFDKAQQARSSPVSRITRAIFPDSTMAGFRFDRFAKQTAAGLASVEAKAGQAKRAAESIRTGILSGPEASAKAAEQLARGYNEVITALGDTGTMLRSAARRFSSKLPFEQLKELGLERQPDDTLVLNAARLAERAAKQPAETAQALSGFADRLAEAAGTLMAMPPSRLLDPHNGSLRAMSSYAVSPGSRLSTYLPVPLVGTLLDAYM
ncbi:hypothetical protein [Paenibacillus puerhi]|uniref:hypothetical protein n=1 Tax=Paenibacillus puerhi TaxID=2692622 RepID=UPI00135923D5|nr:hypothetical protein [Paenibacillus puerhi]